MGPTVAHAQAPAWQTALAVGNTTAQVLATAADAVGNVYVTGCFTGTLSVPGTTLVSVGGTDGFVAKYNAQAGTFWAIRFGGTGADKGTALAVAGTSIYVAGTFDGTATVGGLTLTSAGGGDVAVLKLTDQGTAPVAVWAQSGGSPTGDEGWALAVSGSSVYVGGQVGGTSVFGNVAVPVTASLAAGFVAKLTDAGATATYAWVQTLGGPYYDGIYALAADGASVYAGGFFSYNMTLGGTTLTSAGLSDAVVVKLTDNGAAASTAWVRPAGGPGGDQVNALVAGGGTVYATGAFSATATFGGTSLVSAGSGDVFVAKLTDAGATATYTWAQQAGGPGPEQGYALVARAGSVYVAGTMSGNATFGSNTVAGAGGYDAFVTRVDDAGSSARFAWTQLAGGTGTDVASSVAVANGNLYVGGYAKLPASFGTLVLSGSSSQNGFLSALGPAALATAPGAALPAFALSPNPAHGTATVQLPAVPGATTATLTVLDALGRPVRTLSTPTNARAVLDLTGLAPGLYAVRVAAGSSTATRRLVVE
ncbi:hypothetical protein GCM10028824_27470 [Hymenobacter segetis]